MRFLVTGLVFLGVACATSFLKRFEKIQVGTGKTEVLDSLGSPRNSEFRNGTYVWSYSFYDNDNLINKEIHIKNDQVSYVGSPLPKEVRKSAKIDVGMEKSEVLDILGLPHKTEKKEGKEVWLFVFKDKGSQFSQSVEFENDKVTKSHQPQPYAEVPKPQDNFKQVE